MNSRLLSIPISSALLLAAAFGCGLLEDATTFTLETGWKQVSIDSDALGVTIPSGSAIPAVSCTAANDICAQAGAQISCSGQTYGCKVQCGSQGSCEIVAEAEIGQTVDVSDKVKSQTSATVLSKVSFNYMLFKVPENTLTFDTPKIEVFVGPNAAGTTTDAGVVRFATMEAIPRGQTVLPGEQLNATEEGKNALAGFVKSYQTPFKFFIKASLRFPSGSPVPQGKLTMQVNGYFEIEPLS